MAKKFKDEIKDEIKEEVADIIYEKAKSDVKNRIKKFYYHWKDRILSFLGFGETQEQKIRRIAEEMKQEENLLLSDSVLGIFELFTVKFGHSIVEMIGVHHVENENEIEDNKSKLDIHDSQ